MFREDKDLNETIQEVARVLFVIELIGILVITGLIYDKREFEAWVGISIIMGGSLAAYLSNLVLYALGEIIYELKVNNKHLIQIKNMEEKGKKEEKNNEK